MADDLEYYIRQQRGRLRQMISNGGRSNQNYSSDTDRYALMNSVSQINRRLMCFAIVLELNSRFL